MKEHQDDQGNQVLGLLEQLLKTAITGAYFAEDPYNKNRYGEMKEYIEILLHKIPGFDKAYIDAIDKTGYVTPKVGVNAVIVNDKGELLLEKRSDDKCWGLLGGWAEPGFTAEENVCREVAEEAGLKVEVAALLDVVSRKPSSSYPHTSYHILYHCVIKGGELKKSHESDAVEWKKPGDITVWHFDHKEWLLRLKDNPYVQAKLNIFE